MIEQCKDKANLPPSPSTLKSVSASQKYLIPPRPTVGALTIYLWALSSPPMSHKPLLELKEKAERGDVRNYNPSLSILEPRLVFLDSLDVLSGYALELRGDIVLDAVSLKENALDQFEDLVESLPAFDKRIKRLARSKKYGSNYAYRAYALAAHLWLSSEESALVPEGAVAFLEPSLAYYDSAQWRTSIVLSAISVEYILSEIFEEIFKSPAPEIPLGGLYEQVKKKMNFPSDEDLAIRRTNEIRIKAVHRSSWFASERDALDALMGAMQLTIWYYLETT
jgi:hypothetical protein